MNIRKVAVLGAGVMGSGIAAHLANAGLNVELLDLKAEWSAGNLKKALKSKPPSFMDKRFVKRVRTGSFDDHMDRIADCDWVVEVVTENLEIKHSLYAKVLPHLRDDAILTSNTSGILLSQLTSTLPADVRKRFFNTHFFNPARYMRLLEVIPGPETDMALVAEYEEFAATRLGKGVVRAKDTVNFIANRIGVHGMMLTLHKTIEMGYGVREVDVITGPATGKASSATYKTADVVGLDTLAHVAKNCYDNLESDPHRNLFKVPDAVAALIERGDTGRKAGGGFYKKVGRELQVLNLQTLEYEAADKPRFDSIKKAKNTENVVERVRGVLGTQDRVGAFARATILPSLAYSASLLGEIADDVASIDNAMKWGFNWELGPFELWQGLGIGNVNEWMEAEGVEVPANARAAAKTGAWYPADGEVGTPSPLQRAKASNAIHSKNFAAHILDLGDGVIGFEHHTKMNALDDSVIKMLEEALDLLDSRSDLNGMVISNDGAHFSVGANLMIILMGINAKKWDQVEGMSKRFQDVFRRLHKGPKPVVAAVHNMALGGGAEFTMGAAAVRAHSELYMGLVEVGVGLIPGAGGCLELLKRNLENVPDNDPRNNIIFDRVPYIAKTFMAIGMAQVAGSALEARNMGFLRPTDKISFDRSRLVQDAKQDVLHMAATGWSPKPDAANLYLPGRDGKAVIELSLYSMAEGHHISAHDRLVGSKLANVLCGGDTDGRRAVTEQQVLDLERETFLSLAGEEKTKARIEHMLKTGKPLRN